MSYSSDFLQEMRPKTSGGGVRASGLSVTRCAFVDDLDLLILATEKGDIFVWGSDLDALDRATEVMSGGESWWWASIV